MKYLKNPKRRRRVFPWQTPRRLYFIHIGKCGGASLRDALKESPVVKEQFTEVVELHCVKPVYDPSGKYIFVTREPISRALSAFNWRYELAVRQKQPKKRLPHEPTVLIKHQSLNNLAEALFDGSVLQSDVADDYNAIHHLHEGIAFHLDPLLNYLRSDQIWACLSIEKLDDDAPAILNTPMPHRHNQRINTPPEQLHLSNAAKKNLRAFLSAEYEALIKLERLASGAANVSG